MPKSNNGPAAPACPAPPLPCPPPVLQSRPEDFRAYLAKGLLLQDQGRAGDAQRYFIQARFFAKEQKPLVDQIIAARQ